MSDLAKALNTPVPFEFEGMTWQLTPPKNSTYTKFQRWLELEAVRAVRQLRGDLDAAEYRVLLAAAGSDVAAKKYSVGKPAYLEASQSPEGMREWIRLMLLPCHPQADAELVTRMTEDEPTAEVLIVLLKQIWPDPEGGEGGDPKAAAAGPTAPPSGTTPRT